MARKIIRIRAVSSKTGLSRTTIWREEKAGHFPSRVQLTTGGSVGWFEDEVEAWMEERARGMTVVSVNRADGLLSNSEAASYIGMSKSWLNQSRLAGRHDGPPFLRVGPRAIRYRRADLDAWVVKRRGPPPPSVKTENQG